MAVAGNAAGDYLNRTSGAPSGDYTMMLWLYLSVDRNATGVIFINADAGGTAYVGLLVASDGTSLRISTSAGAVNGTSLATGAWRHVAVTRTGGTKLAYLDGVLDITNTDAANPTMAQYFILSDSTNYVDGRVAALKIWSAVLTADEIKQEMRGYLPVRTSSLHSFNPLILVGDLVDYSGAGMTLTANGTLATEDGPPISWAPRQFFPFVAAGGGGVTVDMSGDPAVVALTGVDPTVVLGSITINLSADPATAVLSAVDPTVTLGSVTVNLAADPVAVALTAVDPTVVLGSVTVNLSGDPATVVLSAVDPTVTAGGGITVDLSGDPASVALTAVDPTVTLGSVTADVSGEPAVLTLTAVDPTVIQSSVTVNLATLPAVVVLTAVDPTVTAGILITELSSELVLRAVTTVELVARPVVAPELVARRVTVGELVARSRP